MGIYVSAIVISIICLIVFYFKTPKSIENSKMFEQFEGGLTEKEQQQFIFAADNCRKENSPISEQPIIEILYEGTNIVNEESFVINDSIVEGCSYHVL